MMHDDSLSNVRRGAVVVEFALVAPLFFLLIFGAVEFSRMMMLRHTAASAAYEGARHGLVPGATAEEAIQSVQDFISAAGMKNATVMVTPHPIEELTTQVTVNVSIPFGANSWAIPRWLGQDQVITGRATLTTERVPLVQSLAVPPPITTSSGSGGTSSSGGSSSGGSTGSTSTSSGWSSSDDPSGTGSTSGSTDSSTGDAGTTDTMTADGTTGPTDPETTSDSGTTGESTDAGSTSSDPDVTSDSETATHDTTAESDASSSGDSEAPDTTSADESEPDSGAETDDAEESGSSEPTFDPSSF